MSTDDPDAEDLAEAFPHVAQLEQQLKESDTSLEELAAENGTTRRDLLAGGAGLLGLGGILTAGSGTARAGDDQVGTLGTDNNRLDGELEDVDLTDQSSTPTGPGPGQVRFYAKNGSLYYKPAGGNETEVGSGANSGSSTEVDLFAVGGQSNAVGTGDSASSPDIKGSYAYEYEADSDSIVGLDDPVGPADTGSAWPAFAIEYYRRTGRQIAIVNSAVGGTSQTAEAEGSFGTWDATGTTLYRDDLVSDVSAAISKLQSNGYDPVFRGILWSQGEQDAEQYDAGNVTVSEYKSAFNTMVDYFDSQFPEDWGFYLFQLGHPNTGDTSGFEEIRAAQAELSRERQIVEFVSGIQKEFPFRDWMRNDLHYNQTGLNAMGYEGAARVANDLARAPNGLTRVYQSTAQSISGSFSTVTFDNVVAEEPALAWDSASNTIQVQRAGVFQITTRVSLNSTDDGARVVSRIALNGANHIDYEENVGDTTNPVIDCQNTTLYRLEAGDEISVEAFQDSASSVDTFTGPARTYLSMAFIRD